MHIPHGDNKTIKEMQKMIKTTEELNLSVNGYRLMTREELQRFEDEMPEASMGIAWWLADIDPMDDCYIAYAEGNYTDDDMYCERSEANTHVRVVLEIEGAELKSGDEFAYKGYVFTILDENIAISNNFIGCAKYYDEDVVDVMISDDEITCTIDAILDNLFG